MVETCKVVAQRFGRVVPHKARARVFHLANEKASAIESSRCSGAMRLARSNAVSKSSASRIARCFPATQRQFPPAEAARQADGAVLPCTDLASASDVVMSIAAAILSCSA